jgi:hypothetical protein
MTREELKEHCQRQIQNFERVEKIMPVTPNDWKRYEEHKLILELLEQENVLDKIDEIITDALDKSTDQKESQTLRWVLDKISEVM